MDPERLESSSQALDKRTRKAQRQETRRLIQLRKHNERRARKLAPFYEFADRNRRIQARANTIAEAGRQDDEEQPGNLVALGLTRESGDPAKKNIVVKVEKLQDQKNPDNSILRKTIERAQFTFFAVNDETLAKLQKNPSGFKINASDWAANAEEIARESTYSTEEGHGAQDYVISLSEGVNEKKPLIEKHMLDMVFDVVDAVDRIIDVRRRIPAHLEALGSSMTMIEEAASNPELNPVLSEVLANDQPDIQAATS